ncbi:muconolactone delta-isomerase [Kribbella orskensis]|uniref:Muconolactone delta-isomerase n=1 Tax=Kribbella orskensis TaxID=2512216 RepID=A0ABY2BC04_9ACTN|nr:muconolactone Delta-isomerase family protein [Kribbella sp. VKM Ac-2500]TCN32713.1 muconolactone delta-isomerase [Kribbella sp. VKM Ac-2500]TCO12970.1 muconolactone delta-isomerase [Kribbella orskensis]
MLASGAIWRIVGEYANVSTFDVDNNDELHDLLAGLPLFPYLDIQSPRWRPTPHRFVVDALLGARFRDPTPCCRIMVALPTDTPGRASAAGSP